MSDTSPAAAGIVVERATAVTPEVLDAFRKLIPQLSRSSPPPTQQELQDIIDDPGNTVFLARDTATGALLGSLTLVTFRIPTGVRAMIEDVVTDEAGRGRGVGTAMTHAALERAREVGAKTVDLTSRPSREAANRLYQRIGFEQRETNVYRFNL